MDAGGLVSRPLPYLNVTVGGGTVATDAAGAYSGSGPNPATVSAALSGLYCDVNRQDGVADATFSTSAPRLKRPFGTPRTKTWWGPSSAPGAGVCSSPKGRVRDLHSARDKTHPLPFRPPLDTLRVSASVEALTCFEDVVYLVQISYGASTHVSKNETWGTRRVIWGTRQSARCVGFGGW